MRYSVEINKIFKYRAQRWKDYTPSVRPSKDEIQKYKQMIKFNSRKSLKCLVFGATPELRDMLFELKCDVTVVDNNQYMIEKMSSLMNYNPKDEKTIVSDWINVDLKENHFDYILGDHVVNMLPISKYTHFLSKVKKLLAVGGIFINRVITIPQKSILTNLEAIKLYDKKKLSIMTSFG